MKVQLREMASASFYWEGKAEGIFFGTKVRVDWLRELGSKLVITTNTIEQVEVKGGNIYVGF